VSGEAAKGGGYGYDSLPIRSFVFTTLRSGQVRTPSLWGLRCHTHQVYLRDSAGTMPYLWQIEVLCVSIRSTCYPGNPCNVLFYNDIDCGLSGSKYRALRWTFRLRNGKEKKSALAGKEEA